jgi:hypothetical protein
LTRSRPNPYARPVSDCLDALAAAIVETDDERLCAPIEVPVVPSYPRVRRV